MQQPDLLAEFFGPLQSAIAATVSDYVDPRSGKTGPAALASKLGMVQGTLANKANPAQEHQFTVREALQLQLATDDFRILYAMALELDHTAYRHPAAHEASDVELLTVYCDLHDHVGQLARKVRDALLDHRITVAEAAQIHSAFDDMVRAGLALVSRIDALSR